MKSNRIFLVYFLICSVAVTGIFSTEKLVEPLPELAPQDNHGKIAQEITNALRFYHYKEPSIDDSLSLHLFKEYLEVLDPSKVYFLQSDIDNFSNKKFQLDDQLKAGEVQYAFDVFNVFRKRMTERIQYVLSLDFGTFDYSVDEYYEYGRDSAAYFTNLSEQDEFWRKKIKYESLNLKLAGKDVDAIKETIDKRYNNLFSALKKQNSEDVFQFYMNALAEVVDPHTSYFSPKTAEGFKITMSNALEGIGATLGTEGEYTKIIEMVKGGPADKSKMIMKNDRIVAVGQEDGEMEDILGWRLDDVVSKIRGPKGSTVRLEILPASATDGRTKVVSIVRDKIKIEEQSAKGVVKVVNKTKIGIISVPSFYFDYEAYQKGEKDYKSTTSDVAKILADFKRQKVKGVMMDLRGNGGGSLYEAVELTGLFINRGAIVQVRDAAGKIDVKYDELGLSWDGPLCVMVDRFSASASEIFAGAIQDYGRGLILGSQTYGKGTVQNLMDINRLMPAESGKLGQLKMTLAKFYRVTGSSTQHKGVVPDIEFPSPFLAEEYGESSEKYALEWDQIKQVAFQKNFHINSLIGYLRKSHESRMSNSLEYKFLLEDIERFSKQKKENSITLNEEILKAQRDEDKEMENARKSLLELRYGKSKANDEEADFLLDESANILVEFIKTVGKNN